jgi:fluoride exporter
MIKNILLVGLGGAAGSVLRFLCQKWISSITSLSFPLGTFLVNIAGCFLIGLFFSYATKHSYFNYNMQLLLMTGLCGGFTTFSAFTLEGMGLIREDKIGLFLLYIGGSVILGLLATWVGIKIVR